MSDAISVKRVKLGDGCAKLENNIIVASSAPCDGYVIELIGSQRPIFVRLEDLVAANNAWDSRKRPHAVLAKSWGDAELLLE